MVNVNFIPDSNGNTTGKEEPDELSKTTREFFIGGAKKNKINEERLDLDELFVIST